MASPEEELARKLAAAEAEKAKKLADEQSAKADKLAHEAEVARDEYEAYKSETNDWQVRQDDKQETDASELRDWQRNEESKRKANAEHLEQEQDARDSFRKRKNLSQLGAYLLIVALGTYGFFQSEATNERTERASEEAAYNLCVSVNENRQVIRGLIARTQPLPPPEGADAALLELIQKSKERNEAFQKDAEEMLAPRLCPPSPFTDAEK